MLPQAQLQIVSFCFDFNGLSINLDTACSSSSLNAVSLCFQTINNGTPNMSIVGGFNLIFDDKLTKGFSQLNTTSVVVLKKLDEAIKDVNIEPCVIKGLSSNVDGSAYKSTNSTVKQNNIQYVKPWNRYTNW
ncbi:hypothetical protein ACTFIU_010738 [Dictyostelium citrinum]